MSDPIEISEGHAAAVLQARLNYSDTGPGKPFVRILDAANKHLADVLLAVPSGVIENRQIKLVMQDPSGGLITADGYAAMAQWITAAGDVMVAGSVGVAGSDAAFKLAGSNGLMLYRGGKVLLDDVRFA